MDCCLMIFLLARIGNVNPGNRPRSVISHLYGEVVQHCCGAQPCPHDLAVSRGESSSVADRILTFEVPGLVYSQPREDISRSGVGLRSHLIVYDSQSDMMSKC